MLHRHHIGIITLGCIVGCSSAESGGDDTAASDARKHHGPTTTDAGTTPPDAGTETGLPVDAGSTLDATATDANHANDAGNPNDASEASAPPGPAHWVSPTGAAAWANCLSTTPLSGPAACSLTSANGNAKAADTIYLRAGSYTTGIIPANSGTESARITFTGYPGETARITGVSRAIDIVGRSYITVSAISADTVAYWVNVDSSHHVWLHNLVMTGLNNGSGWPEGLIIANNSHHNWVKGCSMGGMGYALPSGSPTAIGGMFVGDWEIANDASNYNLLEENVFFHGGHHVIEINSAYNIIRNNYFHNENWTGTCSHPETGGKCGDRNIISEDSANGTWAVHNLIENNRIAYSGTPADGNTSAGMSLRTLSNVVRNNLIYGNDGPGLDFYTANGGGYDARYNHVYSNVFYRNGFTSLPMSGSDLRYTYGLLVENVSGTSGVYITHLSIKNNAFSSNHNGAMFFYYSNRSDQAIAGNWEEQGDPLFMNTSGAADPSNPNQYDFHLQGASPLVNAGAFLTTTTSAGSGTVLSVADAGYFVDGYGLVPGDLVQLQGQTQTARVVGVDYVNGRITVDQALTFTMGQGVSLAYVGSAPDIGAYEYGGGQ